MLAYKDYDQPSNEGRSPAKIPAHDCVWSAGRDRTFGGIAAGKAASEVTSLFHIGTK